MPDKSSKTKTELEALVLAEFAHGVSAEGVTAVRYWLRRGE
jgi:hypothetical protein